MAAGSRLFICPEVSPFRRSPERISLATECDVLRASALLALLPCSIALWYGIVRLARVAWRLIGSDPLAAVAPVCAVALVVVLAWGARRIGREVTR